MTWYGIEFTYDDTKEELEEKLWDAMSARPLPSLPQEIFDVEKVMRQRWLHAASAEQQR